MTLHDNSCKASHHRLQHILAALPCASAQSSTSPLALLQAAAEKAAKAAKRLYVGNVPFETTQMGLTTFFDTIMTDTGAIASNISAEEGSAVTSCTLYDRSSAVGPKAKYAFLNFRSVEETSNCTAFDGIYMQQNLLKVGLP